MAHLRPNKREFQAGVGVRFEVARTEQVRGFFRAADSELATEGRAPVRTVANQHGNERDRDQFTLHDNYDLIGVTLVERRFGGRRAEKRASQHRRWNMHDLGRVRAEIADTLAELRLAYDLPIGILAMRLTTVIPVGSPSGRREGRGDRKFALAPPAEDTTAAFLIEAHSIVKEMLGAQIPGPEDVYQYTPKLTVARIHNTVPIAQAAACGEALGAIVARQPLTIMLTDQHIFDHHEQRQYL